MGYICFHYGILSSDAVQITSNFHSYMYCLHNRLVVTSARTRTKPISIIDKTGSRHHHLLFGRCTIPQQVYDCKYLSCNICFNVLNYVFILFTFNLYRFQQSCHNFSSCD